MTKLTKNQIAEIDLYLKQHDFFYIDLRAEILDAICCKLEEYNILIDEEIRNFLDSNIASYKKTYSLLSKTNIEDGLKSNFKTLSKPISLLLFLLLNVSIIILSKYFSVLNFISDALLFSITISIITQPLYMKLPYFSIQNMRKTSVCFIIPFFIAFVVFKYLKLPNVYFVSLILNTLLLSLILFYFELKNVRNKVKKYKTN